MIHPSLCVSSLCNTAPQLKVKRQPTQHELACWELWMTGGQLIPVCWELELTEALNWCCTTGEDQIHCGLLGARAPAEGSAALVLDDRLFPAYRLPCCT